MNPKMITTIILMVITTSAFPDECRSLNKNSSAYQICMLRKENAERENREKVSAQIRMEAEQKRAEDEAKFTTFKAEFQNMMAISKILNSEKQLLSTLGVPEGGFSCSNVSAKHYASAIVICPKNIIALHATHNSSFGRVIAPLILSEQISTVAINGVQIPQTNSPFKINQSSNGYLFIIDLSSSPDVFSQTESAALTKQDISIYFKFNNTDAKVLFNKYN